MLHVVLYQPLIPPNTGNIGRQCVGLDAHLHLIKPLGFDLDEHAVRRAGLDYWPHLKLTVHDSPEDFLVWLQDREPWLVSKFGKAHYYEPAYVDEDILIFGRETTGLPAAWTERWPDRLISIPILGQIRSFNLANAVAVVLTEATKQIGRFDQ
ncbi:tRNA (cytidine(34)-2'-O)-methyltransferase [bacterium AH-315-I18]|nr:tRNA (cytidine(34)-2'-O)-methyltransferase [Phycisphaeraceae bacterium]MBN4060858.1 tRNA (cytidine(34)-2'-O)-methyltransferase [bacterium AH-315-I18]